MDDDGECSTPNYTSTLSLTLTHPLSYSPPGEWEAVAPRSRARRRERLGDGGSVGSEGEVGSRSSGGRGVEHRSTAPPSTTEDLIRRMGKQSDTSEGTPSTSSMGE